MMATRAAPRARSGGRLLTLARIGWLLTLFVLLVIFIAGLPHRFNELSTACSEEPCVLQSLSPQEEKILQEMGLSLELYAGFQAGLETLLAIAYILLAGLIFWRRRDDWLGILLAYMLVFFGLNFIVEADSSLVAVYPNLAPLHDLLTPLGGLLLVLLFYLFPDGQWVPRWTRLLALLPVAAAAIDPILQNYGYSVASGQSSPLIPVGLLVCLIAGVYAQIYRYRSVSTPMQRQQTKWVMYSLVLLFLSFLIWFILVEFLPLSAGVSRLAFNTVIYVLLAAIILFFPISVVFSILRYRLWDIDIIIRRTLLYGALTAVLLTVYFVTVIVLQSVITAVTGQRSTVVIVLSTLLIAALFAPLRRRLQTIIDRRFYRRRYDAAQTLALFAQTARDEVDLDELIAELLRVVQQTMQPELLSIWLIDANAETPRGNGAEDLL